MTKEAIIKHLQDMIIEVGDVFWSDLALKDIDIVYEVQITDPEKLLENFTDQEQQTLGEEAVNNVEDIVIQKLVDQNLSLENLGLTLVSLRLA